MKRRAFLKTLAVLPFLGFLGRVPKVSEGPDQSVSYLEDSDEWFIPASKSKNLFTRPVTGWRSVVDNRNIYGANHKT